MTSRIFNSSNKTLFIMKMKSIIFLLLFLSTNLSSQFKGEVYIHSEKKGINSYLNNRKEKVYYSIMQVNLMMGNTLSLCRTVCPNTSSIIAPPVYNLHFQTNLSVAPSMTITNGYIFNEYWAAGIGVGFEIFDQNLFPLFGEIRYTVWNDKISPVIAIKGGYAFGNLKQKHYDDLFLNWYPYYVNDSHVKYYGGLMLHPEIGVKVPLNENCDLLFTSAYRFQKTKSVVRKDYEASQFDEWEHKERLNRLSIGIAVMFR